jgi:predicted dehydrogenase
VGLALPRWFVEQNAGVVRAADVTSPNERPQVALIGCGGMGTFDAKNSERFGDVVAVCDVDANRLGKIRETFPKAKSYADYREVCGSKDVDIVINGTPDHWHTLVNLRALRGGKDVYSEKPLTLTIDEGKRVVAAVRETGRVLQTGSQQRSDAKFRLACELVRNGRLGKVHKVDVWLPAGFKEGPFAPEPVPAGLDWDTWLGQAPKVDYTTKRCHLFFRYWWDYSGGTMTDWGAHHNDIALWGLGKDRSGPVSIEGRPLVEQIPGGFTAASQYEVKYVYDNGVEHVCRSTTSNGFDGSVAHEPAEGERHHGVRFEGPEGWIYVTRGKIEASDPALLEAPLPSDAERLYVSDDHMGNFFECVKSRKAPICEAEIGHRSASVCHLGTIAIRLGRKLQWDPAKEEFVGDAEANGFVSREQRKPYSYDEA